MTNVLPKVSHDVRLRCYYEIRRSAEQVKAKLDIVRAIDRRVFNITRDLRMIINETCNKCGTEIPSL